MISSWPSILLIATVLASSALFAAEPRTLAFHPVQATSAAPVIDGQLDDACWQNAFVSSTHYVYWNPAPDLAQIRSDFRMVHDRQGLYLAIVNHEDKMDKLLATRTTRDDPSLWKDDSSGLYFDPAANGVGYVHFTVNTLGTRADLRRIDAAVTENEWSGEQWTASVGKTDKAWVVEAFFPWSELGRTAVAGDVWMFNHVRYAYTSGKFVGSTWSPGGNYVATDRFGYLLFQAENPATDLEPQAIARHLSTLVTPPWQLPLPKGILSCSESGQVKYESPEALLARKKESLERTREHAQVAVSESGNARAAKSLEDLVADLPEATGSSSPAEALVSERSLARVETKLQDAYWQAKLHQLLNQPQTPTGGQ